MSVLMIMEMDGDAEAFKRVAAENGDQMKGIAERAKEHGAIHHAFFVSDDGKAVIVDEWDRPESFQEFFEAEAPSIGPLMQGAGMHPGTPKFFEKVESADQF